MSLGPVDPRTELGVGVVFLALLAGGIGFVLATSGQTLGPGRRFEVELAMAGALKSGARVRLAGREVGEVRGLVRERPPSGEQRVVAECFVARGWARHLHVNSEYFIATPSVLGEAYLEVGPPPHGAEPGRELGDGERVRGVDPPDIDRMIGRLYGDLATIVLLLKADRPAVDELLTAGDALLTTISGLPSDGGQLRRIRDQVVRAVEDGQALLAALQGAGGIERAVRAARELGALLDRARPDVLAIVDRADAALARFDELSSLWAPERRASVRRALATLSHAATTSAALLDEVRALAARVDRGVGTVGAFSVDRELWDDLHETHRILKWNPWRLVVKPGRRAPARPAELPPLPSGQPPPQQRPTP